MVGGNLKSLHQAKSLYIHAAQGARNCVTHMQILMVLMASEGQGRIKEFWGPIGSKHFVAPVYMRALTCFRFLPVTLLIFELYPVVKCSYS